MTGIFLNLFFGLEYFYLGGNEISLTETMMHSGLAGINMKFGDLSYFHTYLAYDGLRTLYTKFCYLK